MEKEKKGLIRISPWWMTTVLGLLFVGVGLLVDGIIEERLSALIVGGIILFWLIFWFPRCFRQVGSTESPAQAVLVRGGHPQEVLQTGYNVVWWPVDRLVIFSTKQYLLNFKVAEVYSKRDEASGQATALMEVDVDLYFAWPRGDELLESFSRAPTPTGDLGEDVGVYTDFFAPTIGDAVRNIMATHTHTECRQDKAKIEDEIKAYLFDEEGNPFKEAHIPQGQLDLAITRIKFTQAMEQAFSAPEVGQRTGEGIAAEESSALRGLIGAFKAEGIGRIVAGIFAFFLHRDSKRPGGKGKGKGKGLEEEL